MAHRVLVVDDEAAIRDTLRMVLEYEGYEVSTVGDGRAALAELDAAPADAVLLDIKMPGMDGLETLDRIVARGAAPPTSWRSPCSANACSSPSRTRSPATGCAPRTSACGGGSRRTPSS